VRALLRARDEHHAEARALFDRVDDDLLTSPLAVAEMDYMATAYARPEALHALWHDLDAGAYVVHWWEGAMSETVAIARTHPGLGLTDASLVPSRAGWERTASPRSTSSSGVGRLSGETLSGCCREILEADAYLDT
jgi:hypothetical protein